ncbi:MAG: holo-ACP synthase [Chlamydiia bacterium]|nr:holo-ACP synthase [Chlamydiia bacterium]
MIKGVGNDIIEIDRIRKTIEKHGAHFYKKFFTEAELDYCLAHKDPALPVAGRFAAKEAIAKALGTGFGKSVSFLDLEIINDALGRPIVECSDSFNEHFSFPQLLVSISHCNTHASAVALWVE